MTEFLDKQTKTQTTMNQILQTMQNQPQTAEPLLGAPSSRTTRTDTEFLIESLSKSMTEFTFDLETNSTFENWYNKYKDLFIMDARNLDDAAKVRLLLRKLDTAAHSKYMDVILPNLTSDFNFAQTTEKLTKLFSRHKSLFNMRHKCLQIVKNEDIDIVTYQASVNKACEEFKLSQLSSDQFKCLIFTMGLQSKSDMEIRTKLLAKLDSQHATITLQQLADECERLQNLKIDSSLIQKHGENSSSILVNQVTQNKGKFQRNFKQPHRPCGKFHNSDEECPAKNNVCTTCHSKGHLSECCFKRNRQPKEDEKNSKANSSKIVQLKNKTFNKKQVAMISVHQVNSQRKFIDVQINNIPTRLQIDSGADITIISETLCNNLNLEYTPTKFSPTDASGNNLNLIGEINCDISLHDKIINSTIYISNNQKLNIFGNDLLTEFDLWNKPVNDFCTRDQINVIMKNNYENFLKSQYPSCFEKTLGKCTKFKAHLSLKENTKPPFCKHRPAPFAFQSSIENELKRLQNMDVISPITNTNCAAPIVAKLKKTGELRLCADFSTGLNEALADHHYPLPLPEDIYAKLNGSTMFSHIDLSDAFLQIEMDEESKQLLIINTHIGLFQYNRLSFGIKPAPAIFQEAMDQMISGLQGVIAYMDDLFIFGHDKRSHDRALIALMNRLKEFGFHIKLAKSKFGLNEIKYLGFVINKKGLQPDPERIRVIKELPPPTNLTELRSFLGTLNFYGKFIRNIHNLRAHLDNLLKKDSPWNWDELCENAFRKMKSALSSELLLTHYNPNLDIIVSADASIKGLGACIQHKMTDGSIRPIAFASRSLLPAEKQYSQIEKEGLGIIFAVQKFHKFIFGRQFNLQTDHKPLLAIFGSKKGIPLHTANRLQRWAIILLAYNFKIEYINTESFAYADFLSRLVNQNSQIDDIVVASITSELEIFNVIDSNLSSLPITYKQLCKVYSNDEKLKQLIQLISHDWDDPSFKLDAELSQFHRIRESLTVSNNIILYGDRIVIPSILRNNVITKLHKGHPGINHMKHIARRFVYWPGIDQKIEEIAKSCTACALHAKTPVKTHLQSWPIPSAPWDRVHIDYAGPFKKFYFLIVVDAYSKWPEIIKTTSTTTIQTIKILTSIFAQFGPPKQLVSDNGPQLTSEKFENFCNQNGIEHIRTAPYSPMSNGQAERFVDTFKRSMKKMENENNLDENLQVFLHNYRSTPNDNCPSKKSPAENFLRRKLRTIFDLMKPPINEHLSRNFKMENQFNSKHGAKQRTFSIGDTVWVKIHQENSFSWKEGVITKKIGKVNYLVETEDRKIHAHTNQMRQRFTSTSPESTSFTTFLDLFEEENQPCITTDPIDELNTSMASLKL